MIALLNEQHALTVKPLHEKSKQLPTGPGHDNVKPEKLMCLWSDHTGFSALPGCYWNLRVAVLCQVPVILSRSKKSVGGTGSHGRKRRTVGHIEAVLSRAQVTEQVRVNFQGVELLMFLLCNTFLRSQAVARWNPRQYGKSHKVQTGHKQLALGYSCMQVWLVSPLLSVTEPVDCNCKGGSLACHGFSFMTLCKATCEPPS